MALARIPGVSPSNCFTVFAVASEGYTDAAGRGMVSGFGLIALGILAASGTGLYSAARAHSWLGVVVVLVLLAAPVLFIYGLDPPYFT